MKSVKKQPARCFDYMAHHISVFLRLAVGILETRAFKINKFCFNLFLILCFKNVFSFQEGDFCPLSHPLHEVNFSLFIVLSSQSVHKLSGVSSTSVVTSI